MRILALLLFGLLINTNVSGQQNLATNYSVNNGLPSNTVRSIYKDTKNRMWIGTSAGVCLFDGKNFQVMGITEGLVGDNVFSIAEDDKQNIWIGSMKGGVSKYDGKSFVNYTEKNGLVNDLIRVVWFSKKHKLILIGTNDGCSIFDGKSFISLTAKESEVKGLFVMGFLDGDNCVNIYTYSPDYYYKYYVKTKTFKKIRASRYAKNRHSTSPLILNNGDTIVSNFNDGINVLNNGLRKSFSGCGQIFDIKQDSDGNIWLACFADYTTRKTGGLYKYDGKSIKNYNQRMGIGDRSVWALYYDSVFSQLWVGTLNEGLFKIPLSVFEWHIATDFGLKELNVKSLFQAKNKTLWIGAKNRLMIRDPKGNIKSISNKQLIEIWGNPTPYSDLEFNCIGEDSKGNVYVGKFQNNLVQFLASEQYAQPHLYKINPAGTIFDFDRFDSLYYSDKWWDRVFVNAFNTPNQGTNNAGFHPGLPIPQIVKIISSADAVWFASKSEGLFMRSKGMLFQFSKINPSLPLIINDICFDHKGNTVIGSNTGDVLIVNYDARKGLEIKHRLIPGKHIRGNTVKFIIADHTNHLFIGTNLGLNRLNLKALYQENKVIVNFFDRETGYSDYSGKTAELDHEGNIWIGTDHHLLRINTNKMNDLLDAIEPDIMIERMEVNYEEFPVLNKQLTLAHDQNNLTFHFETINYLNSQQTLYRYRLLGFSDRWSEFSSETKAVYSSLNPGKYKLVAEVQNTLNNARTSRLEYDFTIKHPWYSTWWFIMLMTIAFILIIWAIMLLKIRKIRREEKIKTEFSRQLANLEIRALQSQMNPHFIFNSINSIQSFILKNKSEEALGYLMDFSKILRQTLENASREFISLDEELQYIGYYLRLEMMRFDQKFEVEIILPDHVNPQAVLIPPMILQPYVENAIRHGLMHKQNGKGKIDLIFSADADLFKCIVQDNGVGRKKSSEIESWKRPAHKPQSTRITLERIALMNQTLGTNKCSINITDLTDKNGEPAGTKVEIILLLILG